MGETRNRVLVTGASGFIGSAVVERFVSAGWKVRATVRAMATSARPQLGGCVEWIESGDIRGTEWGKWSAGCDAVIHLAGRAHILGSSAAGNLEAFRSVNVEGTRQVVAGAVSAGVDRVVLASSIGVHGRVTRGAPFRDDSAFDPQSAYARSKLEAEEALVEQCAAGEIGHVVIRAPLVYGPGVRGNFRRLLALIDSGWPLPFAWATNRRSVIGVRNLADLFYRCTVEPAASGRRFVAAESDPVAVRELVLQIGDALGRRVRLFPLPASWALALGRVVGRGGEVEGLFGSLEVEPAGVRDLLGWTPPYSMDDEMAVTVDWWRGGGRTPARSG